MVFCTPSTSTPTAPTAAALDCTPVNNSSAVQKRSRDQYPCHHPPDPGPQARSLRPEVRKWEVLAVAGVVAAVEREEDVGAEGVEGEGYEGWC